MSRPSPVAVLESELDGPFEADVRTGLLGLDPFECQYLVPFVEEILPELVARFHIGSVGR